MPVFLVLVNFLFVVAYAHDPNPIVTTPMGTFKGSILTTVLGKSIFSFRGIRYAEAPVNELRFKPPVPIEQYQDIYDATDDGAMCPQPIVTPISEDCLFLNVYTTKLPTTGENPKRSVIIYFHPGGFYFGTGSSVWAGPQYFLDQDIVLVTLNYRLGSLGFMSTGDNLAIGNNGLKDQVVALKWVKRNIAAFGGDPDLVTIVGYSAGAISTSLHLVSPMSRGLFHRVLIMSASPYGQDSLKSHQFDLAQKQARLLDCPDDTSTKIVNCLKTKSAQEFGDSLFGFREFGNDLTTVWKPIIEQDFGQERFLTEHPINSVQCGRFANVPIIAGITADEFVSPAFGVMQNTTLLKEMDSNFEAVAPVAFLYERNTENSKHISRELRKFYLGDGPLDNSSLPGLIKLYGDSITGFPVNRAAKLLATKNSNNVYYYRFSFKGRYSYFYLPSTETPYGVVHHDDLIYLFYNSFLFPKLNQSSPEYAMVKKLTTLITNFACTSNPTPVSTADLDRVQWQPFTMDSKKYLDIGKKLLVKQNLYEDRYVEWENLFPLPECQPNKDDE